MFRVCKLSGGIYAYEIDSVKSAGRDIEAFLADGVPVILVPQIEDLLDICEDVDLDTVRIVTDEDGD